MNYSKYQTAIFDFIENGTGHALISAVAGSGKTTTILEAAKRVPAGKSVLFLAFNKSIQVELAERLKGTKVQASTIHSLGFKTLRENTSGRIAVEESKYRKIFGEVWASKTTKERDRDYLAVDENGSPLIAEAADCVAKVVDLCRLNCAEPGKAFKKEALVQILEKYGICADYAFRSLEGLICWVKRVWTAGNRRKKSIDFTDQLWIPYLRGMRMPQYDVVFVDEAQDLNPLQQQLILRCLKPGTGRLIAVGDPRQAIYGFAGADVDAFNRFQEMEGITNLPLSVCYRCGTSIVDLARELNPEIESAPGKGEGLVEGISTKEMEAIAKGGDMVLCRTNAPLVSQAIRFLRAGKAATIQGRDLQSEVNGIIRRVAGNNEGRLTIDGFLERLNLWERREKVRAEKEGYSKNHILALEDKTGFIAELATACDTVAEIYELNKTVFVPKAGAITLSTVHKAKGLEAETVFIIRPEIMPLPSVDKDTWQYGQELNLKYVAITRSRSKLYFVGQ